MLLQGRSGAEDGVRTRDLNLGKVALYQLSHFRSMCRPGIGAESQIRTGDTAIFSRVLYQLSYLGSTTVGTNPRPSAVRRIPRDPTAGNASRGRTSLPATMARKAHPRDG